MSSTWQQVNGHAVFYLQHLFLRQKDLLPHISLYIGDYPSMPTIFICLVERPNKRGFTIMEKWSIRHKDKISTLINKTKNKQQSVHLYVHQRNPVQLAFLSSWLPPLPPQSHAPDPRPPGPSLIAAAILLCPAIKSNICWCLLVHFYRLLP